MPYPQNLQLSGFAVQSVLASAFTPGAIEAMALGIRVDRAASALPATTSTAMFTVTGYVMAMQFLGIVGTVIETQANNYSLEANHTATGANTALCAVLNISAAVAGSLFGITGTLATAMHNGMAIIAQVTPLVIQPGTIEAKTSATNTGTVAWSVWYIPLSTGATVVAA